MEGDSALAPIIHLDLTAAHSTFGPSRWEPPGTRRLQLGVSSNTPVLRPLCMTALTRRVDGEGMVPDVIEGFRVGKFEPLERSQCCDRSNRSLVRENGP